MVGPGCDGDGVTLSEVLVIDGTFGRDLGRDLGAARRVDVGIVSRRRRL